jgi:hypothetical protein
VSFDGGHLGFLINTKKNDIFAEGHPRTIPINFTIKCFIGFREEDYDTFPGHMLKV